jgi:hypothetical protein
MAEENERSITDVLQDILGNVQAIIRSEVRLAKTEVAEEVRKLGREQKPAVRLAQGLSRKILCELAFEHRHGRMRHSRKRIALCFF